MVSLMSSSRALSSLAFGQKFDTIIKDELTSEMEKKEEEDTGKVQTAS